MIRTIFLALSLMAVPAHADTLTIVPVNPATPPVVNKFPVDPATGAMWISNLTPLACAHFAAELANNGLAKQASCATGPVDATQWTGGYAP